MAFDESIIERLAIGDGELIPLRRRSFRGEEMSLGVRHIRNVAEAIEPIHKGYFSDRSCLLVDVYGAPNRRCRPIGHKDWVIDGKRVTGEINGHSFFRANNVWEERAAKRWGNNPLMAFEVEEEEQGNNIGTFLTAVSLVSLQTLQIRTIRGGRLTDLGLRTWRRFGVDWETINGIDVPFAQAFSHPLIDKVLTEFF